MGMFTGLFEEKEKIPAPTKNTTNSSSMNIVSSVGTQMASSNLSNDGDTEAYTKMIADALNHRDLPGPDFLEFYKALKVVASLPIEEKQKYTIALSSAQIGGTLTKDKIIETSNVYLDQINREIEAFNKSLDNFNTVGIQNKQKEIQQLSTDNIELQKKIQENITKISSLTTEVNQNTQKSTMKRQTFDSVVQNEKATINIILQNIKTYL